MTKRLVTLVALTLSACSSGGTATPVPTSAPLATDAPATTVESTTTQAPTTTSTITTTTSTTSLPTTVASTASVPPTIQTAPAETDTEAWAAIIDALIARRVALLSYPATADVSLIAEPGSSAEENLRGNLQFFSEKGIHLEVSSPERVSSINAVTRMDDGSFTIDLVIVQPGEPGKLVRADGSVFANLVREDTPETWVIAPADDPELPWRVRQSFV